MRDAARPAFLTLAETVAVLGIPEGTFRRHYCHLFTDTRPVERRVRRVPRLFRRVEVEMVVERGWEALANKLGMEVRRARLVK